MARTLLENHFPEKLDPKPNFSVFFAAFSSVLFPEEDIQIRLQRSKSQCSTKKRIGIIDHSCCAS